MANEVVDLEKIARKVIRRKCPPGFHRDLWKRIQAVCQAFLMKIDAAFPEGVKVESVIIGGNHPDFEESLKAAKARIAELEAALKARPEKKPPAKRKSART